MRNSTPIPKAGKHKRCTTYIDPVKPMLHWKQALKRRSESEASSQSSQGSDQWRTCGSSRTVTSDDSNAYCTPGSSTGLMTEDLISGTCTGTGTYTQTCTRTYSRACTEVHRTSIENPEKFRDAGTETERMPRFTDYIDMPKIVEYPLNSTLKNIPAAKNSDDFKPTLSPIAFSRKKIEKTPSKRSSSSSEKVKLSKGVLKKTRSGNRSGKLAPKSTSTLFEKADVSPKKRASKKYSPVKLALTKEHSSSKKGNAERVRGKFTSTPAKSTEAVPETPMLSPVFAAEPNSDEPLLNNTTRVVLSTDYMYESASVPEVDVPEYPVSQADKTPVLDIIETNQKELDLDPILLSASTLKKSIITPDPSVMADGVSTKNDSARSSEATNITKDNNRKLSKSKIPVKISAEFSRSISLIGKGNSFSKSKPLCSTMCTTKKHETLDDTENYNVDKTPVPCSSRNFNIEQSFGMERVHLEKPENQNKIETETLNEVSTKSERRENLRSIRNRKSKSVPENQDKIVNSSTKKDERSVKSKNNRKWKGCILKAKSRRCYRMHRKSDEEFIPRLINGVPECPISAIKNFPNNPGFFRSWKTELVDIIRVQGPDIFEF